MTSNI